MHPTSYEPRHSTWFQIFSLLLAVLLGMVCLVAVYTVTSSPLVPQPLKLLLSLIVIVLGVLMVTMKFTLTQSSAIRIGTTILTCAVSVGLALSALALDHWEVSSASSQQNISSEKIQETSPAASNTISAALETVQP